MSTDADNLTDLFSVHASSLKGLTSVEACRRQKQYGPNSLKEEKKNLAYKVLSFFWGPIPWMIEAAAALSLGIHHYVDFALIICLLVFNALVAFWQEYQAGNAIEALKKKMAIKCRVLRDGTWSLMDAANLVPGDCIRVRIGDIIPADGVYIEGEYLTVDQSILTGESLPVDKSQGDALYSGSTVHNGEVLALVTAIGEKTYFGQTAKLVSSSQSTSHFQMAVVRIGHFLIYGCLCLVALLIGVQFFREASLLETIKFSLLLLIASIPVAMPAVLSVTMAIGALALSKMKAIVTRLDSIEEMAGVDTLCCDKTGTLTYNKLIMGTPHLFLVSSQDDLILYAALASRADDFDPIDRAIIDGVHEADMLRTYTQLRFIPFDPISKRTEATVRGSDGKVFKVMKGTPQVVLALCEKDRLFEKKVDQSIQEFAKRGYRTLGVAKATEGGAWRFQGLISLYDQVRDDSKRTVEQAKEHGIAVKMLTGDHQAIALEVARQVDIGNQICDARVLAEEAKSKELTEIGSIVENADGFSQVFPESKHLVVRALQAKGHIVGMTGDGVNDAPALKQANLGIAVSGASDAARAAASLVLTASGLSVIIKGIEEARRIFERMNTYAIYRIAETIRVMLFTVLSILIYSFYPITALMLILLTLLNDIPIMTIAYDRAPLPPKPVKWDMRKVLTIASALGGVGMVSSLLLLFIAYSWLHIDPERLQSIIFLKLSVAGHQVLFIARSKNAFWSRPYPAPVLIASILTTQLVAALLVGCGILLPQIPWQYIGCIWLYTIGWSFIADRIKVAIYRRISGFSFNGIFHRS